MTHTYRNANNQSALITLSQLGDTFTIFRTVYDQKTEHITHTTLNEMLCTHHEWHWELIDQGFHLERY